MRLSIEEEAMDINAVIIEGTVSGIKRPILFSYDHDRVLEVTLKVDMAGKGSLTDIILQFYDEFGDRMEEEISNGERLRVVGRLIPAKIEGNRTFCIKATSVDI